MSNDVKAKADYRVIGLYSTAERYNDTELRDLLKWQDEGDDDTNFTPLKEVNSHMTPLETNKNGGVQSSVQRAYHLVPPDALSQVARIMYNGSMKYSDDNWKKIPCNDHLNHAVHHVFLHLAGNRMEDHLAHAATRMLMALDRYQNNNHINQDGK
jgi:hypothetical protein